MKLIMLIMSGAFQMHQMQILRRQHHLLVIAMNLRADMAVKKIWKTDMPPHMELIDVMSFIPVPSVCLKHWHIRTTHDQ